MQAFLITAFKNQDQLVKLIQSLNENALVFVHIDKKSKELSMEQLTSLQLKNTLFISKYNIPWGGYAHLLAILTLLKLALADERVTFLHTISGQDIRICPWQQIEERFSNCDNIYMTCTPAEDLPPKTKLRFQRHIVTSRYIPIKGFVKKINKTYDKLQKKFHVKYSTIKPFDAIYKGMIWCSMPREAAEYPMNFIRKIPVFLRTLRHVSLPEEFFFQSIFMQSQYRKNVVPNNLRYTDWVKRYGSRPAFLDGTDFDKVIASDCIFARKIDPVISKELVEKIDEYLKE